MRRKAQPTQRFDSRRAEYEARKAAARERSAIPAEAVAGVAPAAAGADVVEGKPQRSGGAAESFGPCVHVWAFASAAPGFAGSCERPGVVACQKCPVRHPVRCGSGSPKKCGPCAALKAGDLAAIVRSGMMDEAGSGDSRRGALLCLVTFTAPGVAVLPWDKSRCGHADGVRCSGEFGCVVEAAAAQVWHRALAKQWSYFRQFVRRSLPGCDVQYYRTYEDQRRGVLHVHAVTRLSGVCSLKRWEAVCRRYAAKHGFGPQVDVSPVRSTDLRAIARAAGYVAKYVTKAYDSPIRVERVVCAKGWHAPLRWPEPRKVSSRLRPWSASREWGDSMKLTRERRVCYAQAAATAGSAGGVAAGAVPAQSGGVAAALTCKRISPQGGADELIEPRARVLDIRSGSQ